MGGTCAKRRLTVHWDGCLSEHLRVNLWVQMLHRVSIWATGHAPHESRWVYLSTWRRHAHRLGKLRRQATRLRAGLAWVMHHAGCHIVTWRHARMLLLHARVWRKSWSGHHFDYRLSTTVDIDLRLALLYNGMRFFAETEEPFATQQARLTDAVSAGQSPVSIRRGTVPKSRPSVEGDGVVGTVAKGGSCSRSAGTIEGRSCQSRQKRSTWIVLYRNRGREAGCDQEARPNKEVDGRCHYVICIKAGGIKRGGCWHRMGRCLDPVQCRSDWVQQLASRRTLSRGGGGCQRTRREI